MVDPDGERQPAALGEEERSSGPIGEPHRGLPFDETDLVHEVRAFAKRQAAEALDGRGGRQGGTDAHFQRRFTRRFTGRIQPDNQRDERLLRRRSGEELLVVRASVGPGTLPDCEIRLGPSLGQDPFDEGIPNFFLR